MSDESKTAQKFPPGWGAERAKRLIAHYDAATEDELAAEDDAAAEEHDGQAVITVPDALLPAIRQLLAAQKSA
jgi:hypothetical protein